MLETLLQTLAASSADFIVVGGLAAVSQGAPIVTHDVDIVPLRTPDNIARLLTTLLAIDARYRGRAAGDIVRPTAEILMGHGHSLLQTTLGPLDVLGAIEGGRTYETLLPHTVAMTVDTHAIRVLDLATIVEIKRASTRRKDQLMLPVLEETMRRR